MAEKRAGAHRENRRQPAPVLRDEYVAEGVDAPVNQVEATGPEAALDCAPAEAELNELSPGDDSVLSSGEIGNRQVRVSLAP